MAIKNDKTTTQKVQKEEWQKPELSELDINKTEGGALVELAEVFLLSQPPS